MAPGSDDPFRSPGSKYEYDEPVCFAICTAGSVIDWVGDRVPLESRWVPETLFERLRQLVPVLRPINVHSQSQLGNVEATRLYDQLSTLMEISDGEVVAVIELVLPVVERVAAGESEWLLIEGP